MSGGFSALLVCPPQIASELSSPCAIALTAALQTAHQSQKNRRRRSRIEVHFLLFSQTRVDFLFRSRSYFQKRLMRRACARFWRSAHKLTCSPLSILSYMSRCLPSRRSKQDRATRCGRAPLFLPARTILLHNPLRRCHRTDPNQAHPSRGGETGQSTCSGPPAKLITCPPASWSR